VYFLGKLSITINNSSFDLLYVWSFTIENVCDLNAEKWPNCEILKHFE
jgi:hypothetical protein